MWHARGVLKRPIPPLRVVYLGHVARLSGGELALLRTLPALRPAVEPIVILAEDGPLVGRLRQIGAEVHILPLDEKVRDLHRAAVRPDASSLRQLFLFAAHAWRLHRKLRSLDADVIHTNTLKAAVYGGLAGRLARIPVVWHVRDRIADDYLPRPAVAMMRTLARLVPSVVITNSNATLATLPRSRSRIVYVIPDPVVAPSARAPRATGALTVGIVGRLSPWKGQDVFLRAFAQAFPTGPEEARIVGSAMFGEHDWEIHLRDLAERLGIGDRTSFRGFIDDVHSELSGWDIAVHASTIPEPFGQVVLEAMAAEVAVIASNEGGPAEVVSHNVDGLLVPPRQPPLLAAALKQLAEDAPMRQRLAAAAAITASHYTPARTGSGVIDAYRSALARGVRGRRQASPTRQLPCP